MRHILLSFAIGSAALAATVVSAEDVPPAASAAAMPKEGFMLRDKDGHRLGRIDTINKGDGYLTYIDDMQIYHVPLSTISVDKNIAMTSLTSAQIQHQ